MIDFPSGQLIKTLQKLEQKSFNGMAEITVNLPYPLEKYSKILFFRQGKIAFANERWVSPQELAKQVSQQLNISIIDAAIKTAETKISDRNSFQEIFYFLARMRIITFQQIEAFILQNIIITLELLVPYSGTLRTNTEVKFDLAFESQEHGWAIAYLMPKLKSRQQEWQKMASVGIDSPIAIPKVDLTKIAKITNVSTREHCKQWLDGRRTIIEIATQIHQDPLKLAKSYYSWTNQNWIYFRKTTAIKTTPSAVAKTSEPEPKPNLPAVLSVDDSPVVQTMLKRALSDRYEVLLANNGMDALKVLNSSKKKIELVLLDVTMPDIDGIELCRTIRRFKKFQHLPIIMLTAKDGMFDKVKGKFAGSTEYLTKPVDKDELLTTIGKYVPSLVKT